MAANSAKYQRCYRVRTGDAVNILIPVSVLAAVLRQGCQPLEVHLGSEMVRAIEAASRAVA